MRTQCELLQLNRATYYYPRKPEVSEEDHGLMKEIDRIYTKMPFYGSRKMAKELKEIKGYAINRKRVQRLMRIMGIEGIHPKKNMSRPSMGDSIYPYLLRGMKARHANHIWGVDITYIPLMSTWMYLVAIIDWYSRYVVSWALSDSLRIDFCIEALQHALKTALPEYHNSDQGSQFTSKEYVGLLQRYPEIKISMDGRGRAYDNIFIERLWRTVKYEEVYLHDYQSPAEARASLGQYFELYNNERLHQSLDYKPPARVYFAD